MPTWERIQERWERLLKESRADETTIEEEHDYMAIHYVMYTFADGERFTSTSPISRYPIETTAISLITILIRRSDKKEILGKPSRWDHLPAHEPHDCMPEDVNYPHSRHYESRNVITLENMRFANVWHYGGSCIACQHTRGGQCAFEGVTNGDCRIFCANGPLGDYHIADVGIYQIKGGALLYEPPWDKIVRCAKCGKKLRQKDRKSTRLNSSHRSLSRMPSSA